MVAFEESKYGWEKTLQVNVLNNALLGLLHLPKLEVSRTGTVLPVLEFVFSRNHERVNLSAEHRRADNLQQSYTTVHGYSSSQ